MLPIVCRLVNAFSISLKYVKQLIINIMYTYTLEIKIQLDAMNEEQLINILIALNNYGDYIESEPQLFTDDYKVLDKYEKYIEDWVD